MNAIQDEAVQAEIASLRNDRTSSRKCYELVSYQVHLECTQGSWTSCEAADYANVTADIARVEARLAQLGAKIR